MDYSMPLVITTLAVVGIIGFVIYRQGRRSRARAVGQRVREHLRQRYGTIPDELNINCSDDPLWPILVDFVEPVSGRRHSLQFMCSGPIGTFTLLEA